MSEKPRHAEAVADLLKRHLPGVTVTLAHARPWASITFSGERLQYRLGRELNDGELELIENVDGPRGCVIADIGFLADRHIEVLVVDDA
jgi:hypothetical protein